MRVSSPVPKHKARIEIIPLIDIVPGTPACGALTGPAGLATFLGGGGFSS